MKQEKQHKKAEKEEAVLIKDTPLQEEEKDSVVILHDNTELSEFDKALKKIMDFGNKN